MVNPTSVSASTYHQAVAQLHALTREISADQTIVSQQTAQIAGLTQQITQRQQCPPTPALEGGLVAGPQLNTIAIPNAKYFSQQNGGRCPVTIWLVTYANGVQVYWTTYATATAAQVTQMAGPPGTTARPLMTFRHGVQGS